MKSVTLQDIANKLGLTKVSISKALRDHPDISVETRKRVKEMAEKLGYRPNLVARSLTSSTSKTIGLIIPKIAHHFFASVVESIYKTAFDNGYEVIIGVSFEDEKLEKKHLETMLEMRVDGLLVSVTQQTKNPKLFEVVRKMGIKLVFFDRGFEDADFSYVRSEDQHNSKLGVKALIDKGFKGIAHIAGYDDVEIGHYRKLGYLNALEEAGIEPSESMIIEGGYSEEDGYKGFAKLLDTSGVPEALFTVTYPVGLGALNCMKDRGIDPETVNILTYGQSDFNEYLHVPFYCIAQPTTTLGKRAVEQLLKEMDNDKSQGKEIINVSATINI